jgi:hypothetical protein
VDDLPGLVTSQKMRKDKKRKQKKTKRTLVQCEYKIIKLIIITPHRRGFRNNQKASQVIVVIGVMAPLLVVFVGSNHKELRSCKM